MVRLNGHIDGALSAVRALKSQRLGGRWFLALWLGLASVAFTATDTQARQDSPGLAQTDTVSWAQLPTEARQVHALIESGGPFRHPAKDGAVFGNREHRLPTRGRGFYREYTVPTPQASDRGAKRLVCGGNQPRAPEVCYYTSDHYVSFRRVIQ